MSNSKRTEQEDTAHVQTALDHLKEKFPIVRIFVSKYDEETGYTLDCSMGGGNFYGQLGQITMWLQAHDRSGLAGLREEDP